MSATATMCSCCRQEIIGREYQDAACESAVCADCKLDLDLAKSALNRKKMVHIYTGPCGDNGKGWPK